MIAARTTSTGQVTQMQEQLLKFQIQADVKKNDERSAALEVRMHSMESAPASSNGSVMRAKADRART